MAKPWKSQCHNAFQILITNVCVCVCVLGGCIFYDGLVINKMKEALWELVFNLENFFSFIASISIGKLVITMQDICSNRQFKCGSIIIPSWSSLIVCSELIRCWSLKRWTITYQLCTIYFSPSRLCNWKVNSLKCQLSGYGGIPDSFL